jgi:hypothetical protein
MKKNLIAAALLLVALSSTSNAHGSVISADDPKFGPASFTIDTATGLEWLDLSQTFDKSINSIIAASGVGGTYNGLRFATKDEVVTFYSDAGLNDVAKDDKTGNVRNTLLTKSGNYAPESAIYAMNLISLLGGSGEILTGITGTGPIDQFGNYFASEIVVRNTDLYGLIGYGLTASPVEDTFFQSDTHYPRVGNFLVREQRPTPTPEPSTLLLIASGLAGLGLARARRRVV